jgi:LysM repeat protein
MDTAMTAFLNARMNGSAGIRAVAAQPRVPIASLEGAGQAAKADSDAHFSSWGSASALTTMQETARASYSISASGPGQNLFDAQNPADRAHVGMAINPADLASWIATQNGVTEAALTAANPGINWGTLAADQRIIIPRH